MNKDFAEYTVMVNDVQYGLQNEIGKLEDKMMQLDERRQQLKELTQMVEVWDNLLTKCKKMEDEIESLQQQLTEEKKRNADLEMKLAEMGKLSAGVAMKASEEAMLKALRTYVNRSKRKTLDKRAFAKTATLEIANANGLILPEDLAIAIDSLDDEQAEPKTGPVTVNGNYNDIHDNGGVILNRK